MPRGKARVDEVGADLPHEDSEWEDGEVVNATRRCTRSRACSSRRRSYLGTDNCIVWVATASHLGHGYINQVVSFSFSLSATHWDIVDMPTATSDDTAPEGYTTVHGYYRFTDIFYEWCA